MESHAQTLKLNLTRLTCFCLAIYTMRTHVKILTSLSNSFMTFSSLVLTFLQAEETVSKVCQVYQYQRPPVIQFRIKITSSLSRLQNDSLPDL